MTVRKKPPGVSIRPLVLRLIGNAVGPIAVYYLLRAAGVSPLAALIVGGLGPMLHAAWSWLTRGRVDRLALFIACVFAFAALASIIADSPRLALFRSGAVSSAIGIFILVSLWFSRPFTYRALAALLPSKAPRLEELWREKPEFRRAWRDLTILWGCGVLLDAALRLAMAYSLPVDAVPALNAALGIATFLVLQYATQLLLRSRGLLKMIFAGPANPERGA